MIIFVIKVISKLLKLSYLILHLILHIILHLILHINTTFFINYLFNSINITKNLDRLFAFGRTFIIILLTFI